MSFSVLHSLKRGGVPCSFAMRPRKALLAQFPWLSPEDGEFIFSPAGRRKRYACLVFAVCLSLASAPRPRRMTRSIVGQPDRFCFLAVPAASAALRCADGDLEKAKSIVISSRQQQQQQVATESKSRDLDESSPKQPRNKAKPSSSDKKRYRGDKLIDQRTKLGRAAMHDMGELKARELLARAAMGRFGGGDNSRGTADLPTVKKKKPDGKGKQKPEKSKKPLSKRKYMPVLAKKNPRREVSFCQRRYQHHCVSLIVGLHIVGRGHGRVGSERE